MRERKRSFFLSRVCIEAAASSTRSYNVRNLMHANVPAVYAKPWNKTSDV